MIDLNYVQTSRIMHTYFLGDVDKEREKGKLDADAYISEEDFSLILEHINEKYGSNIQDQETMKDIIDFTFKKHTRPFILKQVVFYLVFFVAPFLA